MIDKLAINAKMTSTTQANSNSGEVYTKMIAIAAGSIVFMWGIGDDGARTDIGINYYKYKKSTHII